MRQAPWVSDVNRPLITAPPTPFKEKYRIRGGGAIILPLKPGDQLTLIDPEGSQCAELAVISMDGLEVPEAMQRKASPSSSRFQAIFNPGEDSLSDLYGEAGESFFQKHPLLQKKLLSIQHCKTIKLLSDYSRPGEMELLTALNEVICVIAAPGLPMEVWNQNPATELKALVQRAQPLTDENQRPLPAPFFEPRVDCRVASGTALSYEVKEGEYIQIIDVAGKQCSDFLAFDLRALEQGSEFGLDLTTTRTLNGSSYPKPGLYSKFFDPNQQPLVEVICDTVGRHDSFSLSCTAKYYADMGYPGHSNCSDNFNLALEKYPIKKRAGWPAINFFYNTLLDRNLAIYFDEPWSRPGDYVLLRAMKDLVCASSACPDDIDPANGWRPTDIHYRIYSPKKTLSKGTAYRMTPDSVPELTQETAFHPRTAALTRSYTEYRGFWLPTCFAGFGPTEEYYACREAAAVMDLSALRKFEVLGPDAETLLQRTLTRNVRKMTPGQVVYTALCQETGGMLDDGTLFRLSPNGFRWICGSDYSGIWLREKTLEMNLNVTIKSSTSQMHNIAVQGPKSREILSQVIWTKPDQATLSELKWFRFTIGRIKDMNGAPVLVSRTGYSGELGYEIWCHPKDALGVWDAIWEVGEKVGMAPLGFSALDMLRIESGLIFAGYEFDDQVDPFEAGIGFTVALDKEDDFIGKTALLKRQQHPQRVLVGLELEGNETAGHGDCVHVGKNQIGIITSGTRSPILRKNIALCRIAVEFAPLGTQVEVGKLDGWQKRIPATVVKFPFYDPEKKRPRS